MKKLLLITFIAICCGNIFAQTTIFKGVVTDAKYKTPVAYTAIFIEGTPIGTVANNVGEFSFPVPDSVVGRLVIVREGFTFKRIAVDTVVVNQIKIELEPDDFEQKTLTSDSSKIQYKPFNRFFKKAMKFVLNDWIPFGNPQTNKFDFGRIQTLPTYNPIEGVRLRAGIASTSRLNPHFFVKGYAAYGFKDQKFKYRGEAIYSFDKKAYHENEFPKNNLRLVYENDLYSPGEMHPRSGNDLLLITYRRSVNEATYRNFVEINYEREHTNGLAHTIWLRKSRFVPQGELLFQRDFSDMRIPYEALNTSEVGILLRYSAREAYVQQKRKRKPIELESPVFFLSYSIGLKGFLGSETAYHRTELSAQKRFLLNRFGRLDAVGEFSKVWNAVPFPLLVYPNQRYRHHIENNAFFLNRALEFVADEQYTLRTTFVGDDFILSKVPFFDDLGIKELISLRASYGRLSDKNDPLRSSSHIYDFPPASYRYGSTPYVEGTIGITNILGLLRVEYVHRFTYRDHPDALLGKVRVDVTL
ncbi:MAG: DUF5686 family protein [Bacteroidia bacterium]|nr:DUF5686 family protein [Bacteroidia bacterium]